MNTIKAAVVRNPGQDFAIEQLTIDDPKADEVLVKIVGVGVCHSDIAARDQDLPVALPVVLGHEGSGIVEKVGSNVTGLQPGDHVVLSFHACGTCHSCAEHHPSYCNNFMPLNFLCGRLDGTKALHKDGEDIGSHFFGQSSFGTYAIANKINTIKVRNDAPLELLGPLGCGIQTGAGSIIKAFAAEKGSTLLVAGGGTVGLAAVMGGVVQGCSKIIVVEPHASRRDLALSLGATHAIDPMATEDLTAAILTIAPEGLNYAFDTTALQVVIDGIVPAMAQLGTLGLVGIPKADKPSLSFNVIAMLSKGIKVMGITEGDADPAQFIPEMVDLHMDGRFPFDKLCKTFAFDDINAAVTEQLKGGCIKPVLLP
ncbi:MAG: NAD(P)-dependent alcohol dehydrogenase [Porticoccaceae bacterium]